MGAEQKPKVFRLRQLPGDANESQALVILSRALGGLPVDDIKIYSLATSLSPWRPTKTATLMFKSPPAFTEQDNGKDEWQIEVKDLEMPLLFDIHFRGLTPLRNATSEHSFDCISLSGLSSHPFGSWQPKKSDKTFMWIRDELPLDLPQIRPIIYGYETTLPKSRSFQTIDDLAAQLIHQLESGGLAALNAKPVVFLAHSLGGLVLKRAIVALASSRQGTALRIAGGIFFGVPNFGMEQSSFLSIAKGNPNEPLVKDLSLNSPWLQRLESQFNGISFLQKMKMFWGYETCTSPTILLNSHGKFVNGPDVVLLTPRSATRGLLESDERWTFPLNENHSNIVKFSRSHADYSVVIGKIAQICRIVPATVASWASKNKLQYATTNQERSPTAHQGRKAQIHGLDRTRNDKIVDALIASLKAPERDRRLEDIDGHFASTFDWIFDKPESGFVQWLESGEGAFWINGSPGSGKSTLMKYIFQDKRTRELLHDLDDLREEVFAGFFFHHRGSSKQKSFDGLLRSILSQILEQNRKVGHILKPLVLFTESNDIKLPNWDVGELERAFDMILKQGDFELNIHLFLDALDEYHGRPEFISKFVETLVKRDNTSLTRLKICFSSRPWDAFLTRFQDYAALTIQDFTKGDIRRYCLGTMDAELHDIVSVRMEDLVFQVVDRSKGVFLWVRLVTSDLASAANSGASKEDLERLLRSLPAELSDYYAQIVKRTPTSSRWTLYAMLEITARSITPLTASELLSAAACSRSSRYADTISKTAALSRELKGDTYTATVNRVKTRSQGLIQIRGKYAELLHQSVREFVDQSGFSTLVLGTEAKVTFENGFSFLAKWILAVEDKRQESKRRRTLKAKGQKTLLKTNRERFQAVEVAPEYSSSEGDLTKDFDKSFVVIESGVFYAQMSEESTGRSLRGFLNSIPPERYEQMTNLRDVVRLRSALEFAAWARLLLYFRETIQLNPEFLPNCNRSNQTSLASLALGLYNTSRDKYDITSGYELVRFILKNGYIIEKDSEVFSQLLISVTMPRQAAVQNRNKRVDLLIHLLEVGQDANVTMTIHSQSERDEVGRTSGPLNCKPLHISPPEIVPSLLVHGADPNAQDSKGMTPLDRLYCNVSAKTSNQIYLHGFHKRSIHESYQVAHMLLEAGGKRTGRATTGAWDMLMRLFSNEGYDVESLQRLAIAGDSAWTLQLPWR